MVSAAGAASAPENVVGKGAHTKNNNDTVIEPDCVPEVYHSNPHEIGLALLPFYAKAQRG